MWHYVGMTVVEADSTLDVTQLVRQHQADVWRYLRYLGAAPAEAEDLTQETFLEVLRKPFQQRSSAETAAYLRTVARNRLLMQRRSQSRKPATVDVDQLDDVWVATTGSTGSLDPYVEALRHCLETSLDERQKINDIFDDSITDPQDAIVDLALQELHGQSPPDLTDRFVARLNDAHQSDPMPATSATNAAASLNGFATLVDPQVEKSGWRRRNLLALGLSGLFVLAAIGVLRRIGIDGVADNAGITWLASHQDGELLEGEIEEIAMSAKPGREATAPLGDSLLHEEVDYEDVEFSSSETPSLTVPSRVQMTECRMSTTI